MLNNSTSHDRHDEPSAAELEEAIVAVAQAIRRTSAAVAQQHGISVQRLRLLGRLAKRVQRMGSLATELGVSPRSVTTMVDALERDGLLARQPDPRDRRATLLALTTKGLAQFERLRTLNAEVFEEVLAPLTPDERRELARLLRRIAAREPGEQGPRGG